MDIGDIITVILGYVIMFGIPAASLIWLIISVVRFAKVPKTDSELRKKRRLPLVISAVIFGILVLSFVALMIMLSIAMQSM
ncbi:MAG: hypothetical protein K2N49_03335 [Ruminococcus sp.]|nr:hypothetical protein [Ruminococcus sp.]MDE7225878.1 hypothetical protein [Ruminococcus sp.]